MGNNRAKGEYGLRWATVIQWVVAFGVLSALGLNYVWLKNEILRLSGEIGALEKELEGWNRRNARWEANIGVLLASSELERKVREWHLGLVPLGELEVIAMDRVQEAPKSRRAEPVRSHPAR